MGLFTECATVRAVVLGVALAIDAGQAASLSYCTEPSEPFCIDAFGTFDDDWSFRQCRAEVESFVAEANAYAACLEAERARAIDEANEVVDRFNCKARKELYCP